MRFILRAYCLRLLFLSLISLSLNATAAAQALPDSPVDGASGGLEQAKPWLGVAIDKGKAGVLVKDVIKDTPAAAAGFAAGDEITAVNSTKVSTPEALIAAVQAQGVGNSVTIHYLRAGKARQKTVKLVARPDALELLTKQLVNKPAPDFDGDVLAGKGSGHLSALNGRVRLIEFWATWCPACRASHPRLSQIAKEWRAKKAGIEVLAVSDEDETDIKKYVNMTHPAFTVIRDKARTTARDWYLSAIPMLAVVDKKGVVRFATVGGGSYLEEAIKKAEDLASK